VNSQANKTYFDDINLTVSPAASTAEPYFSAVITEAHDYHEFGQLMEGRGFKGDYRYGYQGSEKDNEISGDGSSYTTQFRQLDPRLGRWMAPDPVFQPWQSPYTSMDNDPVNLNDGMGLSAGDADKVTIDGQEYDRVELDGDPTGNDTFDDDIDIGGGKTGTGKYSGDKDKSFYSYSGKKGKDRKYYKLTPSEQKDKTITVDASGTESAEEDPNNAQADLPDIILNMTDGSVLHKPNIVSRPSWGAESPKISNSYTAVDPQNFYTAIVVHHTGNDNNPDPDDLQSDHFDRDNGSRPIVGD